MNTKLNQDYINSLNNGNGSFQDDLDTINELAGTMYSMFGHSSDTKRNSMLRTINTISAMIADHHKSGANTEYYLNNALKELELLKEKL